MQDLRHINYLDPGISSCIVAGSIFWEMLRSICYEYRSNKWHDNLYSFHVSTIDRAMSGNFKNQFSTLLSREL